MKITIKEPMRKKIVIASLAICVFLMGWVSAFLFLMLPSIGLETPLSLTTTSTAHAPQDAISEKNIAVYPDKVVINVNDATISHYAPTGSMRPLLDEGANGIRIQPSSESDIKVGDIITFRQGDTHIVHRVIEKGVDSKGAYFITKGDNNLVNDGKVRFADVEYKTIAIIY